MSVLLVLIALLGYPPSNEGRARQCRFDAVQDSLNARFVGNWPFGFGWTLSLDTHRDIGFISSGAGAFILDLSNPAAPAKLGEIRRRKVVEQLKQQDSLLAIVKRWDDEIELWNVADPAQPAKLAVIPVQLAYAVEFKGRYLYVGDRERFRVVDIQNPGSPVELGSCGGYAGVYSIVVTDTLAYITVQDTGFRVINIRDPASPREIGAWNRMFVNGLAVAGDYVHCVSDSGLRVVNVSDPSNPYQVGSCQTLGFHSDRVVVRDSYAYVADDNAGLTIVDVRDPTRPFVAANWRPPYYTVEDVALLDSFAFLSSWSGKPGLWIINIANPLAPFEAGSYRLAGWSSGVVVEGSYAYLAEWHTGLRILDVTNPACPLEKGAFLTEYGAANVAVRETVAYLPEIGFGGLWVLNVSDPTAPSELGFCPTPGGAEDCALRDSCALVAAGMHGLRVINVADPARPYEMGFLDTPGYARYVEIHDSLAYVADESGGLRIVCIGNPASPREIGAVALDNNPVVLAVKDSVAYVGGHDGNMVVVDVRDPSSPRPIGLYRTRGPCFGVEVAGNYAYVSDWFLVGFHIVDISDPSNPFQAGYYYAPNCPYGLAFNSPYVYVTTGLCGLQVYESLLAGVAEKGPPGGSQTRSSALAVYPNPTTSRFVARWSRSIPAGARSPVLRIYDAAGSCVKSEVLRTGNRPEQVISLEGFNDGVYFVGLGGEEPKVKLLVVGAKPRR